MGQARGVVILRFKSDEDSGGAAVGDLGSPFDSFVHYEIG